MRLATPPLLLLLLLLAPAPPVKGQVERTSSTGELQGRVSGHPGENRRPLAHAMVTLTQGLRQRTVLTDGQGRYRVRGLEPGRWRVRALHVGYRGIAVDVLVPAGGGVELDMELSWQPILLAPVTVRAFPLTVTLPEGPPSTLDVGEVSLRALEGSTGMVEAGLAQVIRGLPGNDDAEPTDVLLMRGSTADLKLVLLDGAPVFTPFHMGGLVESFDPGTLGGASLFLGGAPARFDGGLSYILDLRTRSPRRDRLGGSLALDLLTGRARLEGPLSPTSGFLVSSRTIHDLGTPVLSQGEAPYGYRDVLGRWDWTGDEGGKAFFTGFWNREDVRLELGEQAPFQGARWGNQALSAGLSRELGNLSVEIMASASRYEARLPVSDSVPLFAESGSDRVRLTVDLSRPFGSGTLRFGGSMDGSSSKYLARREGDSGVAPVTRFALDGTSLGGYVEGTTSLHPEVQLRAGLRLDHFSRDPGLAVAPRASVSWFITDDAVLTLAAGRYHQFSSLASGQVERSLASAADSSTGATSPPTLTVGRADHLVVGMDQLLTPGTRFSIQGFTKSFSGVSGAGNRELNASGLDLRVAREGKVASGWLGYSLTWFWASETGFFGGDTSFSGRHLLSAGLNAALSDRAGLQLRLSYGDGLPYTSIPLFSDQATAPDAGTPEREFFNLEGDNVLNQAPGLSAGPDDGFLRLEGELYAKWETSLGGRKGSLRPYVRVLNALDRRDALFYHFDPWRSPNLQPLAELPVLPLLGVEWVF